MVLFITEHAIWFVVYLVAVNLLAFVLFAADKSRARKGKWRISERTLLLIPTLGGSLGALLGMKAFHHKTKHPKFKIGLPLILLLQVLLILYFLIKYNFS